jgi:excinuclease UvrABC ATPase subunit
VSECARCHGWGHVTILREDDTSFRSACSACGGTGYDLEWKMQRQAAALEAENARLREMIGQARYPDCPTTHGIAKMLNAARRGVET